MRYDKYRNGGWAVYDSNDNLVCVTMYKRGATELLQRLQNNSTGTTSTQIDSIKQEIKLLSRELMQANKRLKDLIKTCCTK